MQFEQSTALRFLSLQSTDLNGLWQIGVSLENYIEGQDIEMCGSGSGLFLQTFRVLPGSPRRCKVWLAAMIVQYQHATTVGVVRFVSTTGLEPCPSCPSCHGTKLTDCIDLLSINR